jgi:hypothetical protein
MTASVLPALAVGFALLAADGTALCATKKHSSAKAPQAAAEVAAPALQPKAIDVLKAASVRLAAARSMTFTAVATYESPSTIGPPLAYTTTSDVTLQRPDKLRVITPNDGPAAEFYYDGKTMMAFSPAEDAVAVADAPPTIDAALKTAYETAGIYFPFTDVLVADPYGDLAGQIKRAFYIGQSHVVGGTTTDMVAIVGDQVFAQVWIGADDKLPRRIRVVYRDDPSRLRHDVELSHWQLDGSVPEGTFTSARATAAKRVAFERPDPPAPPSRTAGAKPKASKGSGGAKPQ